MRCLIILGLILLGSANLIAKELPGEWKGAFIINAYVQKMNVYILKENNDINVSIDFPDRESYENNYEVTLKEDSIIFYTKNAQGDKMEYKGVIDGKNITGQFIIHNDYMKGKPGMFQLMKSPAKWIKGQSLPEFSLTSIDGDLISSEDYKDKYVILDFWATWCPPCVEKRPKLMALKEEYGDKLEIISISLDKNLEIVQRFREEKFSMPWPHVLKEGQLKDPYVKEYVPQGLPYGYLISPDNKILAYGNDLNAGKLITTVEYYLKTN